MLELNLRRLIDDQLVSVNIASLALSVRGAFRFPAEEASPGATEAGANGRTGPAVVIHCVDRHDVLQCLEFASRHGLLVVMRNSRLDPAAWADCDQGIAVDLSALSSRAAKAFARPSTTSAGADVRVAAEGVGL